MKVLCWGVRNLKRFRGMNVKSPIVEIEIGGEVKKTSVLKDVKKNPNFQDNRILYFDVVSYFNQILLNCVLYPSLFPIEPGAGSSLESKYIYGLLQIKNDLKCAKYFTK